MVQSRMSIAAATIPRPAFFEYCVMCALPLEDLPDPCGFHSRLSLFRVSRFIVIHPAS
jgi:hypothetical protein